MRKTAILIAFLSSNAFADDLAPLSIFGGQGESEIAGSATYIGDNELKKSGYTDTERIMGRVPGVFSQTEDGLGLRTNIGMRGANPNRTTKINVTEDGILQGPAVYSNASMYFYPDAGDAEGIEVLKGAAAIGNGPRTTSGAINYISRTVPTTGTKGYFNQTAGDEGYMRNHVYYGQAFGNLSFVVESHKTSYDGHKEIDSGTATVKNDDNTGFRKNSDLFKIRYTMPNSYMEFSSQNTSETSHASYIGLTRADFAANENRRYAISSKDKMDNDYHRYIFTYGMDLSPTSSLVAKLYKAKYSRNWKKVGSIDVYANLATSNELTTVSLSDIDWTTNCAADSTAELRACNIITNGTGMVANERIKRSLGHRDYGMYGYDMRYNTVMGAHDITIGYRSHRDYRDRHDSGISEYYSLNFNNTMALSSSDYVGTGGNDDFASADSFSIIDRITHGNFVTTLGLRYEDVDYWESTDGTAGTPRSNSETMIAASTVYDMGDGKSVFAGYSQGYMPTGVSSSKPEESDNYEIGYRSIGANSQMEIVGFYTDYDNLNETCNIAAGCGDSSQNQVSAGEAHAQGIEFLYRVNNLFAAPQMKGAADTGSGVRYPMILAVTLQEAEHDVTTGTSFQDGARIKYTPEEIYYLSVGMETNAWDMNISAKYNDDVNNTGKANPVSTESAWIYDFRSGMDLGPMGMAGARAFLNIDNLFDKSYIASAHNYGVRPNKPQTVMAGISVDF